MPKQKNKETGITLIALVVSIIVLIILAGVSIAMLVGENGIITQAQRAKEETKKATEDEVGIINEIGQTISDKTSGVIESVPGKYYEKDTNVRVGNYIVTIPGGGTTSNISGEYESVDNGFVIYITNGEEVDWSNPEEVQQTYDQFVWIPVNKAIVTEEEIEGNLENYISTNNIYPMAIKKNNGAYSGILYDFKEDGTVEVTPKDYTTTTSYREPAFLIDQEHADGSSYNNVGITQNPDSLQEEFKEMVEGVEEKGGFWVGRYETSKMSSDTSRDTSGIDFIKVVRGTTNGISNINWYRMYAQQKNYKKYLTKSTNTKSSMIWGSQWDQIMIWMKEVQNTVNTTNGNYYITNSVGMGNFGVDDTGEIKPTKQIENTGYYGVKNVYDLAGNVYEWTLEVNDIYGRVLRRR